MELPFTKAVDVLNGFRHVFGADISMVEPDVCPGCSKVVMKHLQHAPADNHVQSRYIVVDGGGG
jgi:hypothetical protein